MSDHEAAVTLRQLVELCTKCLELRASTTKEEFRADWRKQMLGERLIEVGGEAVKRLPDELRERHREIPWRKITGTRDYIAHGYESVDYDVIWGVLDREIAELKQAVQTIILKEFS